MTAKNLTPAQAADFLGVSPSTLRRWSGDFARHLAPAARPGAGRKRSYTPDDLATLKRAGDLLRAGKTPPEVADLLGVMVDHDNTLTGLEVVTLPELVGELAQARDLLRRLAEEVRQSREAEARLGEEVKLAQTEAQAAREAAQAVEARLTGATEEARLAGEDRDRLAGEVAEARSRVAGLEDRLVALEARLADQGRGNWLTRLFRRGPKPE